MAISFLTAKTYTLATDSYLAAVGDVNGDGKADVVISNDSGGFSVLMGKGDGTFTKPSAVIGSGFIALSDMNGDSKLDIVSGQDNTVSLSIGNGDGTFSKPVSSIISDGFNGYSFSKGDVNGDVNGDNRQDIIGTSYKNTILILTANADGTFASIDTGIIPVYSAYGDGLILGDVNNDGILDIVNTGNSATSVLLGNGNGTFAKISSLNTGHIALGDVNNDGVLDLVYAGDYDIPVFLGNGDGTFADRIGLSNREYWGTALVDINGDGALDIISSNGSDSDKVVFKGNGDGTFAKEVVVTALISGGNLMYADINGDGRLDVFSGGAADPGITYPDNRIITSINNSGVDLVGTAKADNLKGTTAIDSFQGLAGNDTFDGGLGSDTADYSTATSNLNINLPKGIGKGGADIGTDTLISIENVIGGAMKDILTGTIAANKLDGGANDDKLSGGAGNDVLIGGEGNDSLSGDAGDDNLDGGNGIDTASYSSAKSGVTVNLGLITAQNTVGAGSDTISNIENLSGSQFNDTFTGNGSDNSISGAAGNDTLSGFSGNDSLNGGDGNDVLVGGSGNDVLTGGLGQDVFQFNTIANTSTNLDTIKDFSVADDTIQLENLIFKSLGLTNGKITASMFKIGTAAADNNDFLIYNSNTGALSYDADGNGTGAAVQIGLLGVNLALTNADFVVI